MSIRCVYVDCTVHVQTVKVGVTWVIYFARMFTNFCSADLIDKS